MMYICCTSVEKMSRGMSVGNVLFPKSKYYYVSQIHKSTHTKSNLFVSKSTSLLHLFVIICLARFSKKMRLRYSSSLCMPVSVCIHDKHVSRYFLAVMHEEVDDFT